MFRRSFLQSLVSLIGISSFPIFGGSKKKFFFVDCSASMFFLLNKALDEVVKRADANSRIFLYSNNVTEVTLKDLNGDRCMIPGLGFGGDDLSLVRDIVLSEKEQPEVIILTDWDSQYVEIMLRDIDFELVFFPFCLS